MKKTRSFISYCTLVASIIVIFCSLNSCSNDDESITAEPIGLNAGKSQYAPYEIVTITASENLFNVSSFTARINDVEIIVGANENSASFVLPNLPNGNYNLTFTLSDKNYLVPVSVVSLSNISSPDVYFNEMRSEITQKIEGVTAQIAELQQNSGNPQEFTELQNDLASYTNHLTQYTSAYNSLSAAEKQEFAKFVAANKTAIDEYNSLTSALRSNASALRSAQTTQDFEAAVEVTMGSFVSSVVFTVSHIPAMITAAKLITSPNPWVSAGAVLGTGIIFTSYCICLDETITASQQLTTKSIKPFDFIMDAGQAVYSSGVAAVSDIRARYRSITNSDGGSGSTINTIVETYNTLREKYNDLTSKLPEILRPSYVIASLKNTYNTATRSIYNRYITITNVSNPNVSLEQINQPDGSIKIKATTTATTDQTFTYNVNYTNSNFTSGLTKTVNAKVVAASTCPPSQVVGTWNIDMYNTCYPNPDGTPAYHATITLTLYEGGTSVVTYGDGNQVSGTWSYNSDCSFSYTNLSWCSHPIAYPPSSPYYQQLYSCGCLSIKHTKQ